MKLRPESHQRIVKLLSTRIDSPTFQEMNNEIRNEEGKKIGRGVLHLGVNKLLDEKIITKDKKTKRYNLVTVIKKNKKIQLIENNKIMDFDLRLLDNLWLEEKPFEFGYALLRTAMFLLPKYTLEINSVFLKKSEKKEIEKFIDKCNKTIEITFEKLHEINPTQTAALRKGLEDSLTVPQFEFKASGLANKRQKKKMKEVLKITGDIK